MSDIYSELLANAERIRVNEQPESNTHNLVGELFYDIIDLLRNVDKEHLKELKDRIEKKYIVGAFGDSSESIVNQEFFTKQVQNRVLGQIELNELDSLKSMELIGIYKVFQDNAPVAFLMVTGDSQGNTITQYLFGNYTVSSNGSLVQSEKGFPVLFLRVYNIKSTTLKEVSRTKWGRWINFKDSFLKVLSEDAYEAMQNRDDSIFYFTYEENI